jgi:hypothetical protein
MFGCPSTGLPDEFVKKIAQNEYIFYTLEKSSPKLWAISIIFQKLPKVNNRPLGEIRSLWSQDEN